MLGVFSVQLPTISSETFHVLLGAGTHVTTHREGVCRGIVFFHTTMQDLIEDDFPLRVQSMKLVGVEQNRGLLGEDRLVWAGRK